MLFPQREAVALLSPDLLMQQEGVFQNHGVLVPSSCVEVFSVERW